MQSCPDEHGQLASPWHGDCAVGRRRTRHCKALLQTLLEGQALHRLLMQQLVHEHDTHSCHSGLALHCRPPRQAMSPLPVSHLDLSLSRHLPCNSCTWAGIWNSAVPLKTVPKFNHSQIIVLKPGSIFPLGTAWRAEIATWPQERNAGVPPPRTHEPLCYLPPQQGTQHARSQPRLTLESAQDTVTEQLRYMVLSASKADHILVVLLKRSVQAHPNLPPASLSPLCPLWPQRLARCRLGASRVPANGPNSDVSELPDRFRLTCCFGKAAASRHGMPQHDVQGHAGVKFIAQHAEHSWRPAHRLTAWESAAAAVATCRSDLPVATTKLSAGSALDYHRG